MIETRLEFKENTQHLKTKNGRPVALLSSRFFINPCWGLTTCGCSNERGWITGWNQGLLLQSLRSGVWASFQVCIVGSCDDMLCVGWISGWWGKNLPFPRLLRWLLLYIKVLCVWLCVSLWALELCFYFLLAKIVIIWSIDGWRVFNVGDFLECVKRLFFAQLVYSNSFNWL